MNKIEELEQRCEQLEDRMAALEEIVRSSVGPAQKAVVITEIRRQEPEHWNTLERGVTWYGGQ